MEPMDTLEITVGRSFRRIMRRELDHLIHLGAPIRWSENKHTIESVFILNGHKSFIDLIRIEFEGLIQKWESEE